MFESRRFDLRRQAVLGPRKRSGVIDNVPGTERLCGHDDDQQG